MTNIADVVNQMRPVEQPKVTERAQIVIILSIVGAAPAIMRYNSLKEAKAERDRLSKAWRAWRLTGSYSSTSKSPARFIEMHGAMYSAEFDLDHVVGISFVDLVKRSKFVPWQ